MRRWELDEIWNWLKPQVTSEDMTWLKKHYRGIVRKIAKAPEAQMGQESLNIVALAIIIQGVLDAKTKESAGYRRPKDGLATNDLVKIAGMLKIDLPDKVSSPELINLIMKEIKILPEPDSKKETDLQRSLRENPHYREN